jgi:hypothetical protein
MTALPSRFPVVVLMLFVKVAVFDTPDSALHARDSFPAPCSATRSICAESTSSRSPRNSSDRYFAAPNGAPQPSATTSDAPIRS